MAGDFGLPYRAPCGGWPVEREWFWGGPYQHRQEAEEHIQRYRNTTTVDDYHLPPGAGIEPYPRLDSRAGWPDTGTCPGPGTQPNPNCAHVTPGAQPCGPWYAPGSIDDRPAGATDHNSYALANGVSIDRSTCHKVGFKNVQARKFWHGRFGYLSHDPAGRSDRPMAADCGCNLEFEQLAPDTTKYLTTHLHCEQHLKYYYRGIVEEDRVASADRTASVGRLTGVVTQTECGNIGDVELRPSALANLLDHVNATAANSIDWYNARLKIWTDNNWTVAETVTDGVYAATATDGDLVVRGTGSLDCMSGAMEIHDYSASGAPIRIETAAWTNTTFTHTTRSWDGDILWPTIYSGTEGHENAMTVTGSLGDAYTSANLVADTVDLLGEWDLADDVVYPWRHDELCCIAPLVSRNEVPGHINPEQGMGGAPGYADPLAPYYDGTVRGAPLDAGYGPHFDYEHLTWRCCRGDDGKKAFYVYAYGQWVTARDPDGAVQGLNDLTDEVVPETATRWTWNYGGIPIAGDVPSGAWLIYQPAIGALVAQKWAEIKILRPSCNSARPCGNDRWALDETAVGCAEALGGNVLAVTPDLPPPAAGDKWLVRGLGALDGVWTATRQSAGRFHLDSRLSTGSAGIPAGDGPILGRLRFPTAPAICGRIALTAATNASPIQITLGSPAGWWTGDQVTIAGATGNTAANGTHTITVIDSTHATLDGVVGNGNYTGGATASSPGAADYQWNDDQAKGEFCLVEWQFNHRDWRERQRVIDQADNSACASCPDLEPASRAPIRPLQAGHGMPRSINALNITEDCLPFEVCCPQVIAISPNGEEWTNGTTYPFGAFAADERYGAAWQMAVLQEMADPWWQAPHARCINGENGPEPNPCGRLEDDGSCAQDTCEEGIGVVYYARRPMVEARISVPNGAPALPAGLGINVLSVAQLNQADLPDGIVLPPPVGLGYVDQDNGADPCLPVSAVTPWGNYLRELACVCAQGRFTPEYQADAVRC